METLPDTVTACPRSPKPALAAIIAWSLVCLAGLATFLVDRQIILARLHAGGGLVPGDLITFRTYAIALQHPASAGQALALPYPLPFYLFAAPLAWGAPATVYGLWLLAGNAALALAGRCARLPWPAILLGLLSPANLYCMAMGQTGELVSAFLILALAMEARPVAAGLAASLVVIKPQFGLLLPVCYLAARHYKAIFAAALGVLALGLVSLCLIGPQAAGLLYTHGAQGAAELTSTAWPRPYQYAMVTCFILLRSLGAGLGPAFCGQAVVTLAALAAGWRLWRVPGRDPMARLATSLCLTVLATPYAYLYDLPAVGMALAGVAVTGNPRGPAALALFWLFTGAYGILSVFWLPAGCVFLALITWLVWPHPAAPHIPRHAHNPA